jgi:hypothetical protein
MKTVSCILQHIYAWIFLFVCFGCMAVVGYWLFIQPSNVLSDVKGPAFVNNGTSNQVTAGQTMVVGRSFCVNNDQIRGVVTRTFTNHVVYQLPDTSSFSMGKGTGCREKQYIVDIPSVLPSGEYEYRVHITYRLNPLKTVTFSLTPIPLQVTNPVWDAAKELAEEKK